MQVPEDEVKSSKAVDSSFEATTRPFQGQAPYILNAMLSYYSEKLGMEAAVSYYVSDRRLYSIALFATPDVYEEPVSMLNLKLSKDIAKSFQLAFTAKNLLDAELKKTQAYRNEEYIAESFRVGSTFALQLSFRIK